MKNARNEKIRINPQAICIAVLALLLAACIVFIGVLSANITSPPGSNSAGAPDVAADNPTTSICTKMSLINSIHFSLILWSETNPMSIYHHVRL